MPFAGLGESTHALSGLVHPPSHREMTRCVGVSDSCGGDPFGDLGNSGAAAAGRVLYRSPGML